MAPRTAADELAERARRQLAVAEALFHQLDRIDPPFDHATVLEPLNELMLSLANLEGEASLLTQVHPEEAVRSRADTITRQVVQLRTRHQQSRRIYTALESMDQTGMYVLANRAATLIRSDMRRAGVQPLASRHRWTAIAACRADLQLPAPDTTVHSRFARPQSGGGVLS